LALRSRVREQEGNEEDKGSSEEEGDDDNSNRDAEEQPGVRSTPTSTTPNLKMNSTRGSDSTYDINRYNESDQSRFYTRLLDIRQKLLYEKSLLEDQLKEASKAENEESDDEGSEIDEEIAKEEKLGTGDGSPQDAPSQDAPPQESDAGDSLRWIIVHRSYCTTKDMSLAIPNIQVWANSLMCRVFLKETTATVQSGARNQLRTWTNT
jgi:hypothetical protein